MNKTEITKNYNAALLKLQQEADNDCKKIMDKHDKRKRELLSEFENAKKRRELEQDGILIYDEKIFKETEMCFACGWVLNDGQKVIEDKTYDFPIWSHAECYPIYKEREDNGLCAKCGGEMESRYDETFRIGGKQCRRQECYNDFSRGYPESVRDY